MRVSSLISSEHHREQIRRRIAVEEGDLSTSIGEIGSDDGEDSPLQSKRSSMLIDLITLQFEYLPILKKATYYMLNLAQLLNVSVAPLCTHHQANLSQLKSKQSQHLIHTTHVASMSNFSFLKYA